MHFGTTYYCPGLLDEAKLSYVYDDIKRILTPLFHHLPSVGPKLLCALAHLGCTSKAGTSLSCNNLRIEFGKLLSVITFYLFSGMVRLTGNLVYGPYFNK